MGDVKVQATVEIEGGKPFIKWKYKTKFGDPLFNELKDAGKREVPGTRWRPAEKVWAAPGTVDACEALRRAYGTRLVVLPALADWYATAARTAQQSASTAVAADATLTVLPQAAPRLFATLRPDQRAGAAWIATGYRGAGLVADTPGLGKTLESIAGIIEADLSGPILVVCPRLSVKRVWHHEITRWTDESVHMARGTRAQREKAIAEFQSDTSERKWLIIVAEMLRVKRGENKTSVKANAKKRGNVEGYEFPDLFNEIWSAVLVDESHRLMGSLTVAKSNLMGEGLASLAVQPQGRRYAITGTPFGKGGRVQGMFGTLHWLWPDEYTSFWRWAERHFEIEEQTVRKGQTARKVGNLRNGMGGEAFLKTLGPRILRRTKAEVLKNLPPKRYVEVLCEMSGTQLRQYRALDKSAEVALPDGSVLMANGVLAEITRARQIANGVLAGTRPDGRIYFAEESCKVDQMMELFDARGLDGSSDLKVLVASQFNEFLYGAVVPALEKAGIKYLMMTGSTSDKERDRLMDIFQAPGGPQVFILNSKAGGISVTLDAADELHQLDEMDNPEDNEQLEDRIHRASRNHQVTIYQYRTEGTYEKNIQENTEEKRRNQFAVLDGRRGVKDVRQIIKYKESTT